MYVCVYVRACALLPARVEGGGDNTRWQARTPSGLRGRERGCCLRERKTYTYNSPIEWASRAPTLTTPYAPYPPPVRLTLRPSSSLFFSRSPLSPLSLFFAGAFGITHWCYNPLVLRRRTCCPVSNTLFFFIRFHLPPSGTHMHTSLPYDRPAIDERARRLSSVPLFRTRFFAKADNALANNENFE